LEQIQEISKGQSRSSSATQVNGRNFLSHKRNYLNNGGADKMKVQGGPCVMGNQTTLSEEIESHREVDGKMDLVENRKEKNGKAI